MGKRRMMAKEIMQQAQLDDLDPICFKLYTYLILEADDDGIVGNSRMVAKMCGCSPALLQTLVKLGYLLQFDDHIMVITHWLIHNVIRKDRYKPSIHTSLRKRLKVTDDSCYIIDGDGTPVDIWLRSGNQTVTKLDTQDKISKEKVSKEKVSKEKVSKDKISEDKMSVASDESSESSYTDFEKSVLYLYKKCCPDMPECGYISEDIRKNLKILEDNGWTTAQIEKIFTQAAQTDYLNGGGKDGWRANLSWLCKEDNLRKVEAGKYETFRKPVSPAPTGNTLYGCSGPGEAELAEIQKLLLDDDPNDQIPALQN